MKPFYRIAAVVLMGLIAGIAQARHYAPHEFPTDFLYAGKPIDPLCFLNPESKNAQVDLQNCGLAKSGAVVSGENRPLQEQGFHGFDYRNPKVNNAVAGSSYYKIWDAGNHHYWVYAVNNSGGSGDFTSLYIFTRDNETTFTIHQIAGGDRCNGGIAHVEQTNYQLDYSVNVTPFDILTRADFNPSHLKAYEDLADCATCCVAKAYYTLNDRASEPRFLHLALNALPASELPTQGKYHACFNKLLGNFHGANLTRLDEKGIYRFANEFNFVCVMDYWGMKPQGR